MTRHKALRNTAVILLVLSAAYWAAMEVVMPTLPRDTIVVKALYCTCPDYRVVSAPHYPWSPALDTVPALDRSEIFVIGIENPWAGDPRILYDHFGVRGTSVGIDRSFGTPYPIIEVSQWYDLVVWPYPWFKHMGTAGMVLAIGMLFLSRKG